MDLITLNMRLASSSEGDEINLVNSARFIANVLYDKNYAGGSDFLTDLLSVVSEKIVSPIVQQSLAGKVAEAVNKRFDMKGDVHGRSWTRLVWKLNGPGGGVTNGICPSLCLYSCLRMRWNNRT